MNIIDINYLDKFPNFDPKESTGNWYTNSELCIRMNPIKLFCYPERYDKVIYDWVIRHYIRSKFIKSDLINLFSKFKLNNGNNHILEYSMNFDDIHKWFNMEYEHYSTWFIADYLGLSQTTISKLVRYIGIEDRSRYCSKLQLVITDEILKILPDGFELEYIIDNYRLDLFNPQLNLCIEIDSEWCHDSDYDKLRDDYLSTKYNIDTYRIDSDLDLDMIKFNLSNYMRSRSAVG